MKREKLVHVFTLPPSTCVHPYVLINANHPEQGLSYIRKYANKVREVIIDSGIEIFRDPNVKDYPRGHIWKIVKLHNYIRRLLPNAEVYATVPDYCDDYHPGSLWLSETVTNIERTVNNIVKYTSKLSYVNWLIPIQGWNKQPESVLRSIRMLETCGIIDKYGYFAVGNLCVEPNINIIYQTIRLIRKHLPNKRIHVFGLKLNALKKVKAFIDSFDSTAWTRPVNSRLNANWSCKNKYERELFFHTWMKRVNEILAQKSLLEAIA